MLGPASNLPTPSPTPQTVPFSRWYSHGWTMIAQCPCGHEAEVHMGAVLRALGEQRSFSFPERLVTMCKCIRCHRHGPRIVVVERSGRIIASSDDGGS